MTFPHRPFRLFALILLAGLSILAVRAHSRGAQREATHAAIITVTPESNKPTL